MSHAYYGLVSRGDTNSKELLRRPAQQRLHQQLVGQVERGEVELAVYGYRKLREAIVASRLSVDDFILQGNTT
jgi:hypothetical protein